MTGAKEGGAQAVGGLRNDQVSGGVLIALALVVVWFNREFPVGTLADPGPGYVPLLLACALGGIGLLVAVLGSRSQFVLNQNQHHCYYQYQQQYRQYHQHR